MLGYVYEHEAKAFQRTLAIIVGVLILFWPWVVSLYLLRESDPRRFKISIAKGASIVSYKS